MPLEVESLILNAVCDSVPQEGCELKEKERFWKEMNEVIQVIPGRERAMIGSEF